MKFSKKVNIFDFYINTIIFLIAIKLFFSYLGVELNYFQRHLTPNVEALNFLGLPADISNKIEYLLFPLLFIFVSYYYKHSKLICELFIISLLMYSLNIITGILNDQSVLNSINLSLKLFSPIYLFCTVIIYSDKTGKSVKKLLLRLTFFILLLTLVAILFFNPSFNRLRTYLPVYFDSIHTHSYVLASVFIGLAYLIYRRNRKVSLVVFLIASMLFLYFGYDVRTVLIMYLLYVITMLFLVSDLFKVLFVKVLIFAPLFVLLGLLIKSDIDYTHLSSGRTSMYADKMDQLATYNFMEWIFGRGYGSDLIATDIWWWDKKGAHSDLITILVENGIIYLLFFLFLFLILTKSFGKINIIFAIVIFGSFFSSTISNGISFRPTANYVFFIVVAYIYCDILKRRRNQMQEKIVNGLE